MWYEYNEGQNILCASSVERLAAMYSELKLRIPGAEIVKYCIGKFVDTPEFMREEFDKQVYLYNLNTFSLNLKISLGRLNDGGILPEGITLCENFESMYGDGYDDYAERQHIDCKNCLDGFVLWEGMSCEQLYRRNRKDLSN